MTIAEWDDGFILDTDPRREDPLYYYMRRDAWKDAIGFEVDPVYQEMKAKEVRISVFPNHLDRESDLSSQDRARMYCRVVSALVPRFVNWSLVELRSSYRAELAGDPSLTLAFETAGFLPTGSTSPNALRWRRT